MKILLVVATDQEIYKEEFRDVNILISGIGILSTAYTLTKELCFNSYDLVINMGIAGSFNSDLNKGEVVEVIEDHLSEIGYEDNDQFVEFTEFKINTKFFVKGKTNLKKVKGITVNTVHGNKHSILEIKNRLHPDIESMEGAAIFKICQKFNTECMQIRSISNKVEQRNKLDWDSDLAISNLNREVEKIIQEL